MTTAARPRGRRPGPTTTRDDIVAAARAAFSELGYERATVRGIARRAGVDPALVYRFFASKEDLLAATLRLPADPDVVFAALDAHPGDEGRTLVGQLLTLWSLPHVREQFVALLRTAVSHEHGRTAFRDLVGRQLVGRFEQRMPGPEAELRAALVAALVAGLAMTRYVIGIDAMTSVTDARLVAVYGPLVQHCLTGALDAPPV